MGLPLYTRIVSHSIAAYLRHVPVARGKTRLFQTAARHGLVAKIRDDVWLRASGLTEAEHRFILGEAKEPQTVALLDSLVTSQMICVDVGANIGYFSVLMARRAHTVHAVEPTPNLATRIRENASLNGLDNIVMHQAALSDRVGTADLHLSSDDPEANSLHGAGPVIRVPLTTLDALSLPHVDLLKLDCEGSELAALAGGARTIARDRPLILCECNADALHDTGHTPADLVSALERAGYTVYLAEQLRPTVWNVLASVRSHDLPRFQPAHSESPSA